MRKWLPIGPSCVLKGQASAHPLVSGRVTGIAPLADGHTIYICTANGGVWKSTNGGRTWISKMEGFQPPTSGASGAPPVGTDSLACGAIAVAAGAGTGGEDRVYVGSGEAFISGDRYFGSGPLISDDGGTNWRAEQATPTLAGGAFWRLAIDPGDPQHVFAATRSGLYERVASGSAYVWNQISLPAAATPGLAPPPNTTCTGVVAARSGTTTHVYAALSGAWGVYHWDSSQPPASQWSYAGNGLTPANPKITVLAMQRDNPQVVYALVSNQQGHAAGVFRLDTSVGTAWVALSHFPRDLFGDPTIQPGHTAPDPGQGDYDIALAVDPTDVNRIYLGGSTKESGGVWSSSLYRCRVTTGTSNSLACDYIGARAHADVHAIELEQGNARTVWVGCDGGVFVTDNALGDRTDSSGHTIPTTFASRNLGLSTVQVVRLGTHPTEDGVLFAGVQDNGTLRYTGDELWLHSADGDGGDVIINVTDTRKILRNYVQGKFDLTSDGGQSVDTWTSSEIALAQTEVVEFYPPVIAAPVDPAHATTANLLAFGSERVWISTNFGQSWRSIPSGTRTTDSIDGSSITAIAWASVTKLYAGTSNGTVARYDRASATSTTWTRRIINSPPATAPTGTAIGTTVPPSPITSIAVDLAPTPQTSTGDSIFITIGGQVNAPYEGRARVWYGTDPGGTGFYSWQTRSGPSPLTGATVAPEFRLLDIHHSVIIVDPAHPERLYTGADIGVWRSHDSGQHWYPYSYGIPEAAVTDLKMHPTKRTLWAGTHGRGVYEISADAGPLDSPVPFLRYLVRDTPLDVGRGPSVAGAVDPTSGAGAHVAFGRSPDIRIDTPARDGTYTTLLEDITPGEFFQVVGSDMKAYRPASGGPVTNRVFVQVHQRGTALPMGAGVQVLLLLAPGATPPDLPAGYTANVQSGTGVNSGGWTTVGTTTVNDVWPLMPRIAHFRLSSSSLTGHNDWCLLVLLHAAGMLDNEFTSTETNVVTLCTQSRLAAWSTFSVVGSTRATSHREPGFFLELLEMIGLSPRSNQEAPAGVVDM